MVFQFVEDIDSLFKHLLPSLKLGGLLVFAVLNPAFVDRLLKESSDFKRSSNQENVLMKLTPQLWVPAYSRSDEQYRTSLNHFDLRESYLEFPPFSSDFLQQYSLPFPTDEPEFLIQAFTN
ncbi:MAG: hypothetical protein COB67_11890 [SAR324 cluster bacterium]|uniref:Uncharacterized protein n=1 Tax=SAR324 cluster bacterium TaxID=2024889 RepID=A0A2A4SS14_9DELT|nr:MAG: hypothetical protein COB67_11890 [SAR324 cluster bacterium]